MALALFLHAVVALSQESAAPQAVTISDALIHQAEDGPPLSSSYQFSPGDPVYASARFENYQKAGEDRQRIHLTYQFDVLDSDGIPVVEAKKDKIDVELAEQDKNWRPKVRHDFLLPPLADSGDYRVVIAVKDELSSASARKELVFRVKGHDVEKSETLVVRNFRFLRSEEDGPALKSAVYRPAEQVWARFDMTGYKLGDNNQFSIAYGLEVTRVADGKKMYAEPNAAQEKDQSFYRKRFTPGVLSLNLQPDTPKGEYTIVLKVRDELGGQVHEARHNFTVE